MHASSYEKMRSFVQAHLGPRREESLTIHDLGSQDVNGAYRDLFDAPGWRYIGMDQAAGENVDLVLRDPYAWREVASGSVDVVVSGQALEHIRYVWITMLEIARILKPGGLCCLIAPAGGPEHRYPVDCWRIYPDGMESLARFAQLDVLQVQTQWGATGFTDNSDVWKDSVLVCRKPDHGFWWNRKSALKRWIQHRSLVQGLPQERPTLATLAGPATATVTEAVPPRAPTVPGPVADPPVNQSAVPELASCIFYHTTELPGGETVRGQWDLRPTVAAYLGHVPLAGRSVLEIGPASGFLTFHMESEGAQVTAVELPMEHLWDAVPVAGFDMAAWRNGFTEAIHGVRRSFQYLHHLHGSRARLVIDHLDRLPASDGPFDVGLLGSVLLHCRSPFTVMEQVARHVRDTVIVTEPYDANLGDLPVCRLLPEPAQQQVDTWWAMTPSFIVQSLAVLGFAHAEVTVHHQKRECDDLMVPMFTVVARRA